MINRKDYLGTVASAAILATALSASPAPAQTTEAPTAGLEEIVVTATKREEKLQNVPIAVTAFTAEQIEISQQRDISDLSANVPNFQMSVGGSGPGASLITLRGLSFQDIEKSFEPPIGLVIDGVYLSTSTGQVAQTFDFEHIEVSAGPQGTLFGKNTTGGVINITRSKPNPSADDISGKIRLTGGNFGAYDGEAVVMVPVVKDLLAFKFAAYSQNDDGPFKDPYTGHNLGKHNYQAFSFAADYRPNDNSDIYLIFDRTLDHSQLYPQISAATPNALPLQVGGFIDGRDSLCLNPFLPGACVNASGVPPSNVATSNQGNDGAYNLYGVTLNASYDFDTFKLVSVTGYRYSTELSRNDYDATQYQLFETQRPESYRQLSEEVRFDSEFDGPFQTIVGAYYFNSDYTLVQNSFLDYAAVAPIPPGIGIPNVTETNFGQYTHQSSMNEALFFNATYDATDKLRFIVGGRQSWDQKRILFSLYSDPNPFTLGTLTPGSADALDHSWAQFTPKFGIEYHFDPELMTYFNYSKGYNSGGFNGRAGSKYALGPYAPEQVQSFEVGVKSEWFDHRLRVNADAFQMNFNNAQEDIIVAINAPPYTSTTIENSANAVFQGFELEVTGKPMPEWTVTTNLGYLNAYYTNFTAALLLDPATGKPVTTDNSGLKVRRTPPFTVGFNSDYVIPAGPGEVGFNVAVKYVDEQQFDLLNDPRGYQGPVAKFDASIRYNIPLSGLDWTFTLWGKNLSDETPKNTFVTGYQGSFVEFWSQEVGRTYGGTIEAKF